MRRAMKRQTNQDPEALLQAARAHVERGEMREARMAASEAEASARAQLERGEGSDDLYILWRTALDEARELDERPANDL